MIYRFSVSCDQTLCAKFNETEQSAAELLRFTLGAVRHLGFYRKWISQFRGLLGLMPIMTAYHILTQMANAQLSY